MRQLSSIVVVGRNPRHCIDKHRPGLFKRTAQPQNAVLKVMQVSEEGRQQRQLLMPCLLARRKSLHKVAIHQCPSHTPLNAALPHSWEQRCYGTQHRSSLLMKSPPRRFSHSRRHLTLLGAWKGAGAGRSNKLRYSRPLVRGRINTAE